MHPLSLNPCPPSVAGRPADVCCSLCERNAPAALPGQRKCLRPLWKNDLTSVAVKCQHDSLAAGVGRLHWSRRRGDVQEGGNSAPCVRER